MTNGRAQLIVNLTGKLARKPAQLGDAVALVKLLRPKQPSDALLPIDVEGLRVAFEFDGIEQQVLSEFAFAKLEASTSWGLFAARLMQAPLSQAGALAKQWLWPERHEVFDNPLLIVAMSSGFNVSLRSEAALRALREAMAHIWMDQKRIDPGLEPLLGALIKQVRHNEGIWSMSDADVEIRAKLESNSEREPANAAENVSRMAIQALYDPRGDFARCRRLEGDQSPSNVRLATGLAPMQSGAPPVANKTGEDAIRTKVRKHYARHPFPRWTSIDRHYEGTMKRRLRRFFSASELAFLDHENTLLVAGCGTGFESCLSAIRYGKRTRVIGLDLSPTSIRYADMQAKRIGLKNVEHIEGALQDAANLKTQFDVIEATGVLHHTESVEASLESLLRALKPGGLIRLGLYSSAARQSIGFWQQTLSAPPSDCDDQAARLFRQKIIDSPARPKGMDVTKMRDFFTMNQYRDLLLHPHELATTLPEIAQFLERQKLEFRGFSVCGSAWADFSGMFPDDPWPGRLENWDRLERADAALFAGMYNFWCRKRSC